MSLEVMFEYLTLRSERKTCGKLNRSREWVKCVPKMNPRKFLKTQNYMNYASVPLELEICENTEPLSSLFTYRIS